MLAIMDCTRTMTSLLCDLARFISLLMRPRDALAAENLLLHKQLAMYQERNLKPRRPDTAFRVALVLLSRFFNRKHALVVIKPQNPGPLTPPRLSPVLALAVALGSTALVKVGPMPASARAFQIHPAFFLSQPSSIGTSFLATLWL